ncbi:hypothetical protein BDN72DRAFT_881674 [Pluteus cervinus]|uniref:Uncharacterized protein n=1 Tax=Pluteus cervinus TaxID=181527 RepID=A0ACD3AF22_9AGAR|nr:hypothetical protein BDN72DRAFT_881674 [Pluteus cervinus]
MLSESRDALVPIDSLPPEILSRIFLLLRNAFLKYTSSFKVFLDWLPIVQVSQHWRQVALDCADLWSELPCNKNLLPLFLARSRTCPVSLSVMTSERNIPSIISALQSLPRIRRLQALMRLEAWNTIMSGLRLPALELTELALSCLSEGDPGIPIWPENFLGGNAPRLRRLILGGVPFPGYLPVFHGLTHLHLVAPGRRTPLAILLGALRQMPNLKSLTSRNTADQTVSENDLDITNLTLPIIMPHLEELSISSPWFASSLLLLNSLRLPKSPTLDFQIGFDELGTTISDSLPFLLQVLKRAYQNGMSPFVTLNLGATPYEFHLIALDTLGRTTCMIRLENLDDEIDLQEHLSLWFQECGNLPLAHLESLELCGPDSLYFFSQYDELPQLKSITADQDDGGDGLIEFLLQNFDWHCGETKGPMTWEEEEQELLGLVQVDNCHEGQGWSNIALPALKSVTFRSSIYDFRKHRYWVQTLMARKRHGYGPSKIVLERCIGLTAERTRDLQAMVEVEWDGLVC